MSAERPAGTERDMERVVRSWLQEEHYESANRVLGAVLDLVDTTPQRRPFRPAWRIPMLSTPIRVGLTAVAAVALVLLGLRILPGARVGEPPSATSTPAPTVSPTPIRLSSTVGRLQAGTYRVDAPYPADILVSVPDGWTKFGEGTFIGVNKNNALPPKGIGLAFVVIDNVYTDGCRWQKALMAPPLGPSVEDLVNAFAALKDRHPTNVKDITVSGFSGKQIEISVPNGVDVKSCFAGQYRSWTTGDGGFRYESAAGQQTRYWILDVRGQRVVLDATWFPGSSASDRAELDSVLSSIQIR